ncbi:MAG: hypothetical protein NWQ31_06810 [Polaribacter sp.]|nr:hypothetical protein [Polaribacter sp.]
MKKLFFVFALGFGLMNFTTLNEVNDIIEPNNIQIELLDTETTASNDVPCRWRTCIYENGVKTGCSEWTYGECNKDSNGKLTVKTE